MTALLDSVKHCPACGQTRDIDDFGRNRSRRDGLTAYCKWCHRDQVAVARQRKGRS